MCHGYRKQRWNKGRNPIGRTRFTNQGISNERIEEALINNQLSYSPTSTSAEPGEGIKILLLPSKSPFVEHSTDPKNSYQILSLFGYHLFFSLSDLISSREMFYLCLFS
jgi:hypothetical protein